MSSAPDSSLFSENFIYSWHHFIRNLNICTSYYGISTRTRRRTCTNWIEESHHAGPAGQKTYSGSAGSGLSLSLSLSLSHTLIWVSFICLVLSYDIGYFFLLYQMINEKPQIIQEYESGKAIPNQQIIGKLERALGVKLRGKKWNKVIEHGYQYQYQCFVSVLQLVECINLSHVIISTCCKDLSSIYLWIWSRVLCIVSHNGTVTFYVPMQKLKCCLVMAFLHFYNETI